jgi:putative SOS response-associated peptidase YedK
MEKDIETGRLRIWSVVAGRRCLIATDGFYEWRKGGKQPFAIACANTPLTVMAGLWETWKGEGSGEEVIRSCTIVTTDANDLLAPIHNRMPVILAEENWPAWLGEVPATEEELTALMGPYPSGGMKLWPISKRVGNVRNNDADLAAEVPVSSS